MGAEGEPLLEEFGSLLSAFNSWLALDPSAFLILHFQLFTLHL